MNITNFETEFKENHSKEYNREIRKQFLIEKRLIEQDQTDNKILNEKIEQLKFKFIYLGIGAKEYFKSYQIINGLEKIIFKLNDVEIEFDETSFVHIINGHIFNNEYIKLEYQPDKSLFDIKGNVYQVIDWLRDTLENINVSNKYNSFDINAKQLNIFLLYKGTNYAIHINQAKRPIKGTGNSEIYQRLGSSYPVELVEKLNELKLKTKLKINEDIELYQ